MNKNELITFLRNPNDLTDSDLGELEKIVENNPYFLSGRLLLARGSKDQKHPETRKRVSSAAVYSTDRPLLKKYLSDKLFFLSKPPEKEDIVPEVDKPKKEDKPKSISEKIEILPSAPKAVEAVEEKKPKEVQPDTEKPRREPRFDPSATASFKRRWDVKSDAEAPPKSKDDERPEKKTVFAGKKIDRSTRVKKKSIREELLDDGAPKSQTPKPAIQKPIQEIQKPKEEKTSAPVEKKPEKEIEKKVREVEKEVRKETPKIVTEPKKEAPILVTPKEKPTTSESIERSTSFFDDVPKQIPQKKLEDASAKPKPSEKPVPPKKLAQEEHTPVVIRTTSKTRLNIPEVPSGGIDAILEELKQDMENLRSSRVKFAEMTQKIEEDDAVSAAVERATKRIPEPEPITEVVQKEDVLSNEQPEKEEKVEPTQSEELKAEEVPLPEAKEVDPLKAKKEETKQKPKAKKAPSTKKKTPTKKESSSKKVTPKKTSTTKTAAKPKSAKTKSTKKEEDKKDDDKSGKQKADQDSIIDKFIAETPSIKYQKKSEPVQNQDLSGESTEWNKELASEYLAEIYLHQGNKKRAIEIYKALSLKFPNKKSYFADLISKTK